MQRKHETFDRRSTVTRRLAVYLPDPIYEQLEQWADEERRPLSNLAAFLLEMSVRQNEERKQQQQSQDK